MANRHGKRKSEGGGKIKVATKAEEQLVEEIERLRQEVDKLRQEKTERKKAEEALRHSEQKYRTILENVMEGYYEVDLAGNFTFVNNSICADTGYSRDELIGMNNRQYMDKETAKKVYQTFSQVYITKEPATEFGFEVIRKNGTQLFAACSVSLIMDAKGQPMGFQGVIRNITEQKKAETALRRNEEKYRTILENITDGYYEVDIAGNFTFFNDSMCKIIGYSRDEMMAMNNRQYMDKENARKVYQTFNKVYTTGKPTKGFDWELIRKDGAKRVVEASVSLVRNPQGEPTGFRGIVRDITERKQVDQLKDEFIGTVSHELRTPLSVIKEAVKLVLDEIPGPIVEEQRDTLTIAEEHIGRISRIIDSLLDISKIESAKVELQRSFVNLPEIIRRIVVDFKYLAEEKKIGLDCEIAEEEINSYCDADKIARVLMNLISNALKFTPQGGRVKVVCRRQESEVLVCVQDTGIGISQENMPKLFDKFSQFGRKSGPGEEGTGLGLTIAKGIVELHKGIIWAESKLNEGSKFYFTLPKVSSEDIFREYLLRKIKQTLKKEAYFSVVLLRAVNLKGLSGEAPEQAGEITKGIEAIIKSGIRATSGFLLKDTGEFLIIFPDMKKADTITVARRLKEKLREFISNQDDLRHDISLLTKVISYPEEASDEHDILNKLEET